MKRLAACLDIPVDNTTTMEVFDCLVSGSIQAQQSITGTGLDELQAYPRHVLG